MTAVSNELKLWMQNKCGLASDAHGKWDCVMDVIETLISTQGLNIIKPWHTKSKESTLTKTIMQCEDFQATITVNQSTISTQTEDVLIFQSNSSNCTKTDSIDNEIPPTEMLPTVIPPTVIPQTVAINVSNSTVFPQPSKTVIPLEILIPMAIVLFVLLLSNIACCMVCLLFFLNPFFIELFFRK